MSFGRLPWSMHVANLMNIVQATTSYERLAGAITPLDRDELAYKHKQMAKDDDAFPFFRATYYRWATVFGEVLPAELTAPRINSVGDLHLENFGTWRDIDARPVFGINDLDEVDQLPYSNDLVRLAASFRFAVASPCVPIHLKPKDLAAAVLDGYRRGLSDKAAPIVLSEDQGALGQLLGRLSGRPDEFWKKIQKHSPAGAASVAAELGHAIAATAPPGIKFTYRRRRRVGLGSLGRPRILCTAELAGARILREAKARVPSATMLPCQTVDGAFARSGALVRRILDSRTRAADPTLHVSDRWVIRRLAPDALKLDLAALQHAGDWFQLATAMGRETANIHLSGGCGNRPIDHLRRRPPSWLNDAAKLMVRATTDDWRAWCDYWRSEKKR